MGCLTHPALVRQPVESVEGATCVRGEMVPPLWSRKEGIGSRYVRQVGYLPAVDKYFLGETLPSRNAEVSELESSRNGQHVARPGSGSQST